MEEGVSSWGRGGGCAATVPPPRAGDDPLPRL